MAEIRLQSAIVERFSIDCVEKRGQLFHVANERKTKLEAVRARSIGIFPGVSDLVYFDKKIKGIEVKEPKSRHKVSQIRKQVNWGLLLEGLGHEWRLVTSVEQSMNFILDKDGDKGLTTSEVLKMIDNTVLKTVVF